jgi:4'-phosphopantetheinyl transferase
MPVTWQKNTENYSIIVWHSTEPMDLLLQNAVLNDQEYLQWQSFQSESRKREWLTVRNALRKILPEKSVSSINYDDNGKPHLKNEGAISISHSHQFIAVMKANETRIGVDIEVIHPRIEKLSKKFMNENEKSNFGEHDLEKLHVVWGAKEVLYKIHSIGGIDFKKDFLVHPFNYKSSGTLKASIMKKGFEKDFIITYEKSGVHMLAWSLS